MTEPLLAEQTNRFTLFPIKYKDIWDAYKTQQKAIWSADEIDYLADLGDWETLKQEEKIFIENILAFFAGSDGIVLENLITNFCNEIQIPEVRAAYSFQAYMENVHSEVYSLLIDTYIKNNNRKAECFNAIETIPAIKKKADWALHWINNSNSFAERLIAFVGVFDKEGRGSRRDIDLPFHQDGDYSSKLAKKNNKIFDKKVDIVGLYCIKGGESKTLIKYKENISEIILKTNQGVVFDNKECLHSRKGTVGDRILLRIWIEKNI